MANSREEGCERQIKPYLRMLHFNPQKMTISSKKTQTKATNLKTHV